MKTVFRILQGAISSRMTLAGALGGVVVLLLVVSTGELDAQEESAPTEPAAAPAEAAAAAISPEPSEPSTRALRGLLLDIATAGPLIVAVGERGNIVASKDGQHWAQVPSPVRSTLTAVTFVDEKNGWAVGHDAAIVHTADGGRTWTLQNFQPDLHQPLLDVLFLDGQHGYAVGTFGLFLETRDAGTTWTALEDPVIKEAGNHLNAIIQLGDGSLFLAGETGFMARSVDGSTWTRVESPYEGSYFGAVPDGAGGVIVFGLRGNAFRTASLGQPNWQKIETGGTRTVFGGALVDGRPVLVGADGLIARVDPAGNVSTHAFVLAADHGGGTLSATVSRGGGLITVGEYGIQTWRAGS